MKYSVVLKIFTIISAFFFSFNIIYASSASIYFGSLPKTIEEGEIVTISVKVKDSAEAINAVSGTVSFPENLLQPISLSKEKSLVTLWIQEPKIGKGKISFEGVILNPGFQGDNGLIFQARFKAKNTGQVNLNFIEGSVLANDGLGTNVLASLNPSNFRIVTAGLRPVVEIPKKDLVVTPSNKKIAKLPVITDYSISIKSKERFYVTGKGEPNLLTKIMFDNISIKSMGERFLDLIQTKKKKIDSVIVKNDNLGNFTYVSPSDLLAGVYSATPFLVDEESNQEKPGVGVQLFVSVSKVVKYLIIVINILALLIPIVTLCVIIYFIPWYSWLRMRVLKKKLGLEEEKIQVTENQLIRKDNAEDNTPI